MTDKQIIIDGEYWRKKYGDIHIRLSNKVAELEQQLSRKEQECEELKKWLPIVTRLEVAFGSIETEKAKAIDYNTYAVEIFRKLDQLEEENKELRQLLSKEPLALQALQRAYSSYKKSTDVFYKMAKDYKQALKEIKDIVDTCNSGINCSECPYAEECRTDTESEALGICKLIQQKCEVLDE